jgi:CBS domain-containing protein
MNMRGVLKAKGRQVITIGTEATVTEAVARLVENDIGSLPVVDSERGLVGIFTERDVLRGLKARGEAFCHARISDVMTRDPVSCHESDSIQDAMGKMSEYKIGQLPVLDERDVVVGVVSVGDMVKMMHAAAEAENQHLLNYLYGAV